MSSSKVALSAKPRALDERQNSSAGRTSTPLTRATPSAWSSKPSALRDAAEPATRLMKPLSSSGTASRLVDDAGDTCGPVHEGAHVLSACRAGGFRQHSQNSSPAPLLLASPFPSSISALDATARTAHGYMGLRRTNPPDHHGCDRSQGRSSDLSIGISAADVEDAADQASIRDDLAGGTTQASPRAPTVPILPRHPLSSQQPLQSRQQRSDKPHDSAPAELCVSSSSIGSLLLNNGIATLSAAGSNSAGGSGGSRHRRSTSGAGGGGGESASSPASRNLQPPANHSHVNLFVRDLPPELNEEKLRAMFTPFGDIVNSAIMRNIHTGVSLGTAFVRFAKHEEAMHAMEAFSGGRCVTGTKRVTVQWARREHDKAPSGDERRKMRKLFIRNVPKDVTQEMLAALFSQYGPVKSVSTHRDTAAASAVTHSGGGVAAAAMEADVAYHSGHDSAAAGASIDDRRIAFVTFEMEGVAEQATAAVHNTMPFASCQGIPLMVKLAEDTPVRHNALNSSGTRFNSIGAANGGSGNGNVTHLSQNGSVGSGGSVGEHHSTLVSSVPNNSALSWSDLPISDYLSTPMTSPPAAQLHGSTGLTMAPGGNRGMPLVWGETPGASAGRNIPRAPQDGSVAPVVLLPRSFAGTKGAPASPSGTPTYAGLSPVQSSSAVLPYALQGMANAPPPQQPVQSLTALSAPSTSVSVPTVAPQQTGSCKAADSMLDGTQALASAASVGLSSGSYNVQGMCSGPTDPIGVSGGDYSGCFSLSSYDAQELHTMLQQYGSNLAVANRPTAQPPLLSKQPSGPIPGANNRPHASSGNSHSNQSACPGGPVYQVLRTYTGAPPRDGVTSPPLPPSAHTPFTTPLNNTSFQSSSSKGLSLPQPRSGAVQQPKQQQQPASAESDGSNMPSSGHAPTPYRFIPQPRSNAGFITSVPLSRSAAAAAASAAALAPSPAGLQRANTFPPDACLPSSTATPQNRVTRGPLPSASTFFTAGGGGAHSKSSGAASRRFVPEEESVAISGAMSLRHGPRATSSSLHSIRGGTSGGRGCSFSANSLGAASGTLSAPVNCEFAPSVAGDSTNDFQTDERTGILGFGSLGSHGAPGAMDARGTSTIKFTAAPPPPGRSPVPHASSRRFYSELKQPVTAAVTSPTFTTAPLMAAAAKMLLTEDSALTADETNALDGRAHTADNTCAAKSNYHTSYTAKVMGAANGSGPPLCGATSGVSSSNVNMSDTQSSPDAVRDRLNSPAPAATASYGRPSSAFRKSGYLGDARPRSLSLGGAGFLGNGLLFQWEGTSAEMSGLAERNHSTSAARAASQSSLLCNGPGRCNEPTGVWGTISIPSEPRTEDLIALADTPKAASASNMQSQPETSAYWSTVPMRDTTKLVLGGAGGSGEMEATAHQTPSTATSTPMDLSHRSTARALPGVTAQPPSRHTLPNDEDESSRGWIVYPDFQLNLSLPLGPSNESKKSGGVMGSGCESGSSPEGVDHLLYSQHFGNGMDNLYNLMRFTDASY
ncbi:hypothetical protein LSCM1_04433 [Leishmania martiniquensis]|uniref:RRM domain-containing protein n=1 Tax=Leishmania martiniquensis TaxID=1580590 RepID=A0A836HBS1_9TRYP|nr:hypothetical protein LSCM1_04433 [Leishmania martiniquensis]